MVTRVFLTPTKSYWTCFAIPTAANIMNMSNATTAVEMMVRAGHGASDQVLSCIKHIVTHQKENGAIMPGAAHHPNTHTFGKSRPVRNSTSSTRTFQPVKWNYIFFLLWNFTGWLRFVYFFVSKLQQLYVSAARRYVNIDTAWMCSRLAAWKPCTCNIRV